MRVFTVCNLSLVFEKAQFDVAGMVLFREIWNTVNRSKNATFHRCALSHFPFKLFYGQSHDIFHNPKCKITLFENRSILESTLRLKVSFSPCCFALPNFKPWRYSSEVKIMNVGSYHKFFSLFFSCVHFSRLNHQRAANALAQ